MSFSIMMTSALQSMNHFNSIDSFTYCVLHFVSIIVYLTS